MLWSRKTRWVVNKKAGASRLMSMCTDRASRLTSGGGLHPLDEVIEIGGGQSSVVLAEEDE